jgi:hypothetical protein
MKISILLILENYCQLITVCACGTFGLCRCFSRLFLRLIDIVSVIKIKFVTYVHEPNSLLTFMFKTNTERNSSFLDNLAFFLEDSATRREHSCGCFHLISANRRNMQEKGAKSDGTTTFLQHSCMCIEFVFHNDAGEEQNCGA